MIQEDVEPDTREEAPPPEETPSPPDPETQDAEEAPPEQEAQEETPDDQQASSLETDHGGDESGSGAPASDASSWEQRYKNLQPEFTRRSQQMAEMRKRLQAYEEAEQQRKAQVDLRAWDPKSDKHQDFRVLMGRYDAYKRQVEGLPADLDPAEKARQVKLLGSQFSEEEAQEIREYAAYLQDQQRRQATDPDFMRDSIDRRIEERLAQRDEEQRAKAYADQRMQSWFQGYEGDARDARAQQIQELYAGDRSELIDRLLQAERQLAALQGSATQSIRREAQAQATISGARSASVSARGSSRAAKPDGNPYDLALDWAKKHGEPSPDLGRLHEIAHRQGWL